VGATALITFVGCLFLRGEAGRDFAKRSVEELGSESLRQRGSLLAVSSVCLEGGLEDALLNTPWLVKVGVLSFLTRGISTRGLQHVLTVLYKMGLRAFVPLLAVLAYFFWSPFTRSITIWRSASSIFG